MQYKLLSINYVMYAYGLHLFYLATKNLYLVTIFYHFSCQMAT